MLNYLTLDAVHVREEHRIVGTLVGCLPRLPRQNIQLGLPLQLSIYEARLLLEKGRQFLAVFQCLLFSFIYTPLLDTMVGDSKGVWCIKTPCQLSPNFFFCNM